MNKRQAKKRFKKALSYIKNGRRMGIGVSIRTHDVVDKNGKPCEPDAEGARYIQYKHPQIRFYKSRKQKLQTDNIQ